MSMDTSIDTAVNSNHINLLAILFIDMKSKSLLNNCNNNNNNNNDKDSNSNKVNINHLCYYFWNFLPPKLIAKCSALNKTFRIIASQDFIWKPLAINKWPELKEAKSVEKDPFPAWKSCYSRKAAVPETNFTDLMSELGDCDFYSCPNGHLYVIGECRLPMAMGRCPECGANIGGRHHTMLSNNNRLGAVRNNYIDRNNAKNISFHEIQSTINQVNRNGPYSNNSSNNLQYSWAQRDAERKQQRDNQRALAAITARREGVSNNQPLNDNTNNNNHDSDSDYDEDERCAICHKLADAMFLPCRHTVMCGECYPKFSLTRNKCTTCNATIDRVLFKDT